VNDQVAQHLIRGAVETRHVKDGHGQTARAAAQRGQA
jgi:hypothetical protein